MLDPVSKRQPSVTSREFDVFLKMLVDIFFLHYFNQPVHGLKLRDKFGLEKKAWCGTDWLELDVWLYGRLLPLWNYIDVRSPLTFPCLE